MRTMTRRAALGLSVALLCGSLTACAGFLVADQVPQDQREEVFEFDMQPGTMNPAEAEAAIGDQIAPGRIIPGSASHRGSVVAPGGVVDFFSYRMIDPDMGGQLVFCTSTVADLAMSAGCADQPPAQPVEPIELNGESWGDLWRSAEFFVRPDVARVEGTGEDGTVYTITPVSELGYVEWPDERGSLELVAFDSDGRELGRAFAGIDR